MVTIKSVYIKNEELLKEIDKIRWREKNSFSEFSEKAFEEYTKNHSSGNSQYTLDHVIKATPAFMASLDHWKQYYESLNDNEELDLRYKIQELIGLHYKKFGVKI